MTGMDPPVKIHFHWLDPTLKFNQYGESRAWISDEIFPHTAKIVDEFICICEIMRIQRRINHDPCLTFFQNRPHKLGNRPKVIWAAGWLWVR